MSKMNYNCIKEVLASKDKTNRDLSTYMGVHENSISAWCKNRYQPSWENLFKIAEFLEVEARELLTMRKNLRAVKKDVPKKVAKKDASKKKQ